jgi:hypothetical protein
MSSYRIIYNTYNSNELKTCDIILSEEQYLGFNACVLEFKVEFKIYLIDHDQDEFIEVTENEIENSEGENSIILGLDPQYGSLVKYNDVDFLRGCEFFCDLFDVDYDDYIHNIENE